MSLVSTSVKKPITTALCFIAVILFGIFSYQNLAVDLLPKIDTNAIMVMTSYPGASASDIENNVTKPVENVLNGVGNMKHLSSSSRENISIVNLEFEFGIDIDVATNEVRDKLELVKSMLPEDAENPIIFKFGADDIPIMILSVTADKSTNALYKLLDDKVASPLARVSGVGTVSISGTAKREINIYCDPYKLDAYGLTVEGLAQIIGMENKNIPGGNMDLGSNTYTLRVQGEFVDASQMLDIVVGTHEGKAVYLKEVARVDDSLEERAQESYTNAKKGAMIVIQKQSGGNSVNIANVINERLPELQKTLPSDVELGVILDTSTNILNIMDSLIETILVTMLIVALVVFVFLGRWSTTVIVLITIPISLIGAFIYLFATGNTLNIISLSSLSLAIGMVVDNSIVSLENIMNHLTRGSKPKQAAIYATKEVAISIMGGTLTMLAVFLPLTMVGGMTGILFKQLGWIVSIIMILSMVVSITLIPMMSSKMLTNKAPSGKAYNLLFKPIERMLDGLDRGYARMLEWAVNNRKKVIIGAFMLFLASLLLVPGIRTEFFPTQDSGRIGIKLEMPIGTRQTISVDVANRVSKEFMEKYPEIDVINYSVGQADPDNAFANMSDNGTHLVSYNISLCSMEERERGLIEICELMRKDLDAYTELKTYKVTAGGEASSMGGETSVDVEIYGYDFTLTDEIAAEVSEKLRNSPLCSQVNISRSDYAPELQVDFDREKLALNGLNVSSAANFLRNRVNGSVASYYREDGEEYDIRIRFAPEYRESIEAIENILIYNSEGKGIRVRDLGTVIEESTPPTIERKDRERLITVSGVVAQGAALSELVNVATETMNSIDLPSDITWSIGGTFEDQQETFGDMYILMVMIVILVFIVMASQFESLTDPFVIMFSIPFAFSGVFLGLGVTNTPLGVMAMIGVLILLGVVVKNGIVLIDFVKLNRERGMGIRSAVVAAGKSRLRPVLMTTLTTVLGMLPLALGRGEGSEMWRSMGMTVAWGLSISTVLTLILVPVMYCVFAAGDVKRQRKELAKFEAVDVLSKKRSRK